MKPLLCILLLVTLLLAAREVRAGDCVPRTFERLSGLNHSYIPREAWALALHADDQHSPSMEEVIDAWNRYVPDHHLVCLYEAEGIHDAGTLVLNLEPQYNVAHLWVGIVPDKLLDKTTKDDAGCHAALVYFTPDHVTIVHPITVGESYTETLDYDTFFARTILVFSVLDRVGK